MKWTLLLGVAAVALFVLAPMAMAADHAKADAGIRGAIKSIETSDAKVVTGITLTVKAKEEGADPETKVIKVTEKTKVQAFEKPAEGEKPAPKAGKIEDLKVGQRVYVKLAEDGTADTITIGGGRPGGAKKAE